MVDLVQEIKARGRKPAFGPMSAMRNKRILAQAVEDEDRATAEVFQVLRLFWGLSYEYCWGWSRLAQLFFIGVSYMYL